MQTTLEVSDIHAGRKQKLTRTTGDDLEPEDMRKEACEAGITRTRHGDRVCTIWKDTIMIDNSRLEGAFCQDRDPRDT